MKENPILNCIILSIIMVIVLSCSPKFPEPKYYNDDYITSRSVRNQSTVKQHQDNITLYRDDIKPVTVQETILAVVRLDESKNVENNIATIFQYLMQHCIDNQLSCGEIIQDYITRELLP